MIAGLSRHIAWPAAVCVNAIGLNAERTEAQGDGFVMIPHAIWDCGMPDAIPSPADGQLIFEIDQILVLRAADGSDIFVRNAGVGNDASDARVVMDFEAPNDSDHAWLNVGKYVPRRELNPSARPLSLRVYDVAGEVIIVANRDDLLPPPHYRPRD